MKFMRRRRQYHFLADDDQDPMSGVANLFDIGLVFIVGLLLSLFATYHLDELFNVKSNLTIMKRTASGELEIITKKGHHVEALKVSRDKGRGMGERLGTAYRLRDGSMIYVPDEKGE